MNTIKECFEVILGGNKDESRRAARRVRKLEITWKPEYGRYKYVSSLPAGPYKSVQMVMARIEELCGVEYMEKLKSAPFLFSNY